MDRTAWQYRNALLMAPMAGVSDAAYRIIARMLDDWDELAEDWAFASDPELADLLEAAAAKL